MKPLCYKLKVEGFNQMRLISELVKSGIKLSEIDKKTASEMSFIIAKKDSVKAFAILEKLCYNYTITARSDINFVFGKAAARLGLIVGMVLFCTALALFYGFIWRIEIDGNEKVNDLVIVRALKEQGITTGKLRKNLDKNSIKNIVNSLDDIIECSVEIKGTTIRIEVMETADFVPPEPQNYTDILSIYDAEVTRMITTAGTALVKPGSRIYKGTALIGAYRLSSELEKIPTEAKGKIYGKVAFYKSIEFSRNIITTARTGKKYVSTDYKLYGLKINGRQKHGFENFETEVKTVNVFENTFLPLKMTQTTYYETTVTEVEVNMDETVSRLIAQTVDELIIRAGGSEIETSHILVNLTDNTFRLVVYMQAEMLIGTN